MSHVRRNADRRRRVLYSAHQADHSPSTAASRREAIRLREARRPQAAYGSRVHRRIRGRWFSLVPIRRRTMLTVSGMIGLAALLLCGAHYASVAWPAIAYRPEIARPLRLDRPDSFGRWFMVAVLTVSAGVSLMIYQLRRYRNDDFQGHYRLWRLVLVVMTLASVNALVSMIDWCGALLDASFGERVALTGSDWIRLFVSLGGAVLALRLIAEVRRCRAAVVLMLISTLVFAIPEAAKWNVLAVDTLAKWTLVTSAPLLGCTTLLLALGSYLRMLYREVKEIGENDSLKDRLQNMRLRLFHRSDEEDDDPKMSETKKSSDSEAETDTEGGRWWRRKTKAPAKELGNNKPEEAYEEEEEELSEPEVSDDDSSSKPNRSKRRWFGMRKAKQASNSTEESEEEADLEAEVAKEASPQKKEKKRRRFSMRLSPPATDADGGANGQETAEAASEADDEESQSQPKRKRGLGWLRRKKSTETDADSESSEMSQEQSANRETGRSQNSSDPDDIDPDDIDPDDIDWSALSKAERRRLRKQLKRQNRAA